ncbi:hypothetical protein [Streptomyces sp. NPDC049916]
MACSASAQVAGVRRRMRVRTALARCPGVPACVWSSGISRRRPAVSSR